ncbi:MAG: DUF4398 domain-containing protein [Bacteriovoracia bacterium]
MIRPIALLLLFGSSCAITATRPLQEMSDTAAALKAAKEVNADRYAPELYRQARELWFKARQEYKFKDYKEARESVRKARQYAERAEFEALASGAKREALPEDPMARQGGASPADENFEAPRNEKFYETAEEEARVKQNQAPAASPTTTPGFPPISR